MKNIFTCWDEIMNEVRGKEIFLFTDYDGTLTKIVRNPKLAILGSRTRKILEKLLATGRFHLAVISGRSIEEIKNFVSFPHTVYAGFHGCQIEQDGIKQQRKAPFSYQKGLIKIKNKLSAWVRHSEYLRLENKGDMLALHYRRAPLNCEEAIRTRFLSTIKKSLSHDSVSILFGKKVFEIRPKGCDKGWAVKTILTRTLRGKRKTLSIFYLGDDMTDEDAFQFLSAKGITVLVGHRSSKASYFIPNQGEVYFFLKKLYAAISLKNKFNMRG
ncbi:MAG: trehalose-phosphatase [Candidatus Aureabacteria bacterium]|nr:trehalose-phosphatase [Candidatus Auribacterota bacterium]